MCIYPSPPSLFSMHCSGIAVSYQTGQDQWWFVWWLSTCTDRVNWWYAFKTVTTVLFSPLLTELTTILDTNGELSWPESLKKVITEPLNVSGWGTPLVPADVIGVVVYDVFSGRTMNSHRWTVFDNVHVSCSWSPTWQTGAILEGEISITPAGRAKPE